MTDDEGLTEEERLVAEAHLAESGPVQFVLGFVAASLEGRFEEARACLDIESPIDPNSIGDPYTIGISYFALKNPDSMPTATHPE